MLFLTRRAQQEIHIGNDVVVTVVGCCKGGSVRLGVSAPQDVLILRGELKGRDKQEGGRNEDAAAG